MKNAIRAAGVENNVTLVGHRSDLREVMAASDVVVSCSTDPEAFGRVTLEALAIGKPVAAYAHGGVGEQLSRLFSTGCVQAGNTSEMVDYLTYWQKIPPEMTLAIARRESEFYPKVASPVGALGMMQVMPKTAKEMAKRLGLKFSSERMLSDWKYNAKIGIAYLEELSERGEFRPGRQVIQAQGLQHQQRLVDVLEELRRLRPPRQQVPCQHTVRMTCG